MSQTYADITSSIYCLELDYSEIEKDLQKETNENKKKELQSYLKRIQKSLNELKKDLENGNYREESDDEEMYIASRAKGAIDACYDVQIYR